MAEAVGTEPVVWAAVVDVSGERALNAATTESDMEDGEQLAIIRGPGFGLRDTGTPMVWFGVSMLGAGALQCFTGQEALAFVKDNDVTDIKHLDGAPCVVEVTDRNIVRFKRLFKP